MASFTASVKAMYPASQVEVATVAGWTELHEIAECLYLKQKPVVLLLVLKSPAYSESQ